MAATPPPPPADEAKHGSVAFARSLSRTGTSLKALFEEADSDGSGHIHLSETAALLQKLGMVLPEAEMRALFAQVDTSGDGSISLEELQSCIEQLSCTEWTARGAEDTAGYRRGAQELATASGGRAPDPPALHHQHGFVFPAPSSRAGLRTRCAGGALAGVT